METLNEDFTTALKSSRKALKASCRLLWHLMNIERILAQTGRIIPNSGFVGGWSIESGVIKKDTGTNATSAGMSPTDYPFFAGATYANRATAPFRVTNAGAVYGISGELGGWTLNSVYQAKDTGTNATSAGMAPSDYPFYAGSTYANRATAPFRVTPAGAAFLTNATIQSASSGQRIVIDSATNTMTFYSASSDNIYAKIDDNIYDTGSPGFLSKKGDFYGLMGSTFLRVQGIGSYVANGIYLAVGTGGTTVHIGGSTIDFELNGIPTTSEVGGSGWKTLYVQPSTGKVARND